MIVQKLLGRFGKNKSSDTPTVPAWLRTLGLRPGNQSSPSEPIGPAFELPATPEDELDEDLVKDVFEDSRALVEASAKALEVEESGGGEFASQPTGDAPEEGIASDSSPRARARLHPVTDTNVATGTQTSQPGGEDQPSDPVDSLKEEAAAREDHGTEPLAGPGTDPVQDTSRQPEPGTANQPAQQKESTNNALGPLMKTMVEIPPEAGSQRTDISSLLPDDLEELFQHKETGDVRIKMLLSELGHVDVRELYQELTDFAKSIGAIPNGEATPTVVRIRGSGEEDET